MNRIIKKLFIKNYKDVKNPLVRASYGVVAGVIGIISNAVLFAIKLLAGILSGSVAVVADAINNLSDFLTSIITIIGFKVSSRPADKEHPYGHQRLEYITALIVAFIITFIGVEAARSSIEKIINGGATDFSYFTCAILGASVFIKFCLFFVYGGFAKDIDSEALKAMSADSRNDMISTSVVLACAIVGMIWGIPLDGYLGVAVSVLIIISAVKLIKETVDPLIGIPPDKETVNKIREKIKSYNGVLDVHDLIVHNYGPSKTFASVHIEVDACVDIMISHDLADNIERDFYKQLNMFLVCHLDPVKVSDAETALLKEELTALLREFNPPVTLHDFRVVEGVSHTNVIFDAVIPFGRHDIENDIKKAVEDKLAKYNKTYYAVIEFEHTYD